MHAKEHKNLAEALLTYETLDAREIHVVLEGKKLKWDDNFFKTDTSKNEPLRMP